MIQEKWTDLEKGSCPNHYTFKTKSIYSETYCSVTINFSQCAFDINDEALVAVDTNGTAYYIDLTDVPAYKKLGNVGSSTFLTFNPKNRSELLVGLSSTNIKVLRINVIDDYCLLSGHTAPPMHVSFYKDYCLTSSSNEVIIWQIKSYCKAHQLRLNAKDIVIKKSVFSSLGIVAVLYRTNLIQCWMFQQFDKDYKVDAEKYGLRNVKDFDFTKDGRAMIVCGLQNKILIFNTAMWDLVANLDFSEKYPGGRQLLVVPLPLDGGANNVIVVLTSSNVLKYISLSTSSILDNCCESNTGIKKVLVSHNGRFLVCINKHGFLDIIQLDKQFKIKLASPEKQKEHKRIHTHKADDHLKCIKNSLKEELKLQRLLPILKEFGEYPERYRALIWATVMELPNNKKAYIELSNKVPHESMFKLLNKNRLLEKCKSSLLGTIVSCLIHWSPVLEEYPFLPKMILPFVNVFEKNPVLGFESSVFILINYCQKWFEYHPLPPLNVLGMAENILLEADPLLFNYFCEHGVTSSIYIWTLLQTMLSEVLTTNDWLIMWDHLISFRKPWYLLMCTVAYNISYRKTIMTKLQTLNDFEEFYTRQGHVSVKNILKIAHKLDCDTPHRIHPCRYLKNEINTIPKKGPYLPFLQFEFPKYLTDELRGINLKKLKDKERRLRALQLHAMELMEEKRLRTESEHFIKHIHEMRLNELRKCYENQVCENERLLEYGRKETKDLNPFENSQDHVKWNDMYLDVRKSASAMDNERRKKKNKNKNCKLLQEQVDRLEHEIQHLLTTLYNNSRAKSRLNSRN